MGIPKLMAHLFRSSPEPVLLEAMKPLRNLLADCKEKNRSIHVFTDTLVEGQKIFVQNRGVLNLVSLLSSQDARIVIEILNTVFELGSTSGMNGIFQPKMNWIQM
jgi:hypothetical protein